MSEPTQRQVDADIARSMDLFQRADVGEIPVIHPARASRVLAALDGSSQDFATALLAAQIAERFQSDVGYLVVNQEQPGVIAAEAAVELERIGAAQITAAGETNDDKILAAADQFAAELIVSPCPFGRDFHALGEDSTGTVIDVLIARSKAPFIAVRRPDATGRDPTRHLRIVLTGENPAASTAAAWAAGVVQADGRLELLLLVEESFYENFREALHSIRPEVSVTYEDLEHALARTYGRLHAALQRTSMQVGFDYELLVHYEAEQQPITPEDPRGHPALMVVGMERKSHDSQAEIRDFVRRSPHPTLVVGVD